MHGFARIGHLAVIFIALAVISLSGRAALGAEPESTQPPPAPPSAPKDGGSVGEPVTQKLTHQNAEVEFSIAPEHGKVITEGEQAVLRFSIKDGTTGEPLSAVNPAVWLDLDKPVLQEKGGKPISCKEKIGLYMQGSLSYRPDLDLNSYFILSMNNDATISVTDPIVSFSGVTQLYTMIYLKRPGEDWAASPDDKTLFVTMPKADQVAVASTETFKVLKNVDVGENPVRIALQPDARYLWVGNDSLDGAVSGVTVIDAESHDVVARIPTAPGHHEIAFTEDSLYAFVTNSKEGTLSIIDVAKLKKSADLKIGVDPISMAYSRLSKSLFVANTGDGSLAVVDGSSHKIVRTVKLEPGLRVVRVSPDGRYAFVANGRTNKLVILDAATHEVLRTVDVDNEPDQIAFTKEFVYVRCKGSEAAVLIPLRQVGKGETPAVSRIAYGQQAPGISPNHAFADAIVPTPEDGHVLIANPADRMIYYYMEGMQFAMGSFRSYGGTVQRAVRVVDRSVREMERGVYGAKVRVPSRGRYQVALLLDSPRILHCFEFTAKANPVLEDQASRFPTIEYLTRERRMKVGERFVLQFKLARQGKTDPITGVKDLIVQATLAPGNWFEKFKASEVGNGVYEVALTPQRPGSYYLTFSSNELKMDARHFPYVVLLAHKP
ncbi:MAG: hypothetical protein AB9873_07935 [Syntrophobacteraceae bacterium]